MPDIAKWRQVRHSLTYFAQNHRSIVLVVDEATSPAAFSVRQGLVASSTTSNLGFETASRLWTANSFSVLPISRWALAPVAIAEITGASARRLIKDCDG